MASVASTFSPASLRPATMSPKLQHPLVHPVQGIPLITRPISHLQEFNKFEKLPVEIRAMIWTYAEADRDQQLIDMNWKPENYTTPTLLHVCPESRAIALKYNHMIRHQRQNYLFVDGSKDILSFEKGEDIWPYLQLWKNARPTRRSESVSKPSPVMDYETIKKEIKYIEVRDRSTLGYFDMFRFSKFKGLKRLTLHYPWPKHAVDSIGDWRYHWLKAWRGSVVAAPQLVFEYLDCFSEACGCGKPVLCLHC